MMNKMLDMAELKLENARKKTRETQLDQLKKHADPNYDYHKKVAFIEGNVEKGLLYFEERNEVMTEIALLKE